MQLDLKKFCLFVGYARSGSSAVGSIVDAHPNAIISHEYHVLSQIKRNINREDLFNSIIAKSQNLNQEGRWSGGAKGEVYRHVIDGQIKRNNAVIEVIGDKKSGSATKILQTSISSDRAARVIRTINNLEAKTGLPCYFIHVIRNPYDIVAAQIQSRIKFNFISFLRGIKTMTILKEIYPERWLDVYHEDLITEPENQVKRIVDFLELKHSKKHLNASVKHLKFEPKLRRFEIDWNIRLKKRIKSKVIREVEFFNRYNFKV